MKKFVRKDIFISILDLSISPYQAYTFIKNRRQGVTLMYQGYMYRKKVSYRYTTNWVCKHATYRDRDQQTYNCPARCVTDNFGGIKLSVKGHSHKPVY